MFSDVNLRVNNEESIYKQFMLNIAPVKHIVTPIQMESIAASKLYVNEQLDFVFIDASHEYANVIEDIKHWLPKVKKGGVLAGHDYNNPSYAGVKKAVDEALIGRTIDVNGMCWIVKI
jgi:predicted O-methyltransferase YrrM